MITTHGLKASQLAEKSALDRETEIAGDWPAHTTSLATTDILRILTFQKGNFSTMTLRSILLGTTVLTHPQTSTFNSVPKSLAGSPVLDSRLGKGEMRRLQRQPRPGSTAIRITNSVEIPHLDAQMLNTLHSRSTNVVTRHINKSVLEPTLRGSFRFGTISKYRPADRAQIGRFSDFQEGLQRDIFRSRNSFYNADLEGCSFRNVRISGFENPISLETTVNEYCSCSSRSDFDMERAELIRERGNPDVDAYVVYDLDKLIAAVEAVVAEQEEILHLKLIARDVEYGEKDRHWAIEGYMRTKWDKDHLAIWLGNIFVKSPDYKHEDEMRMILIDPEKAGLLPDDAAALLLEDHRIADAIICHGYF